MMRTTIAMALVTLWTAACASTTTQQRGITRAQLRAEEAKQREFVLSGEHDDERRLLDLAFPMLRAARGTCSNTTGPKVGFRFGVASAYKGEWRESAVALGLSDTATVLAVGSQTPAERAGLRRFDRIVAVGGKPVRTGNNGPKDVAEHLTTELAKSGGAVRLSVVRGGAPVELAVVADTVCAFDLAVVRDDMVNAFADGQAVYVTTGMMRFGNDEELATVIAHEIAHNAMRHIQAKQRNATIGALFGALLDVAAASQGVNTNADFTNQFGALGAMTFSQDFEREADYVGMYILAQAGKPLERSANLWRKMAQASPGSIKFASSHPTSAERYLRLEQAATEIAEKRAAGLPLQPEKKAKK